jgi:hypothetical protein
VEWSCVPAGADGVGELGQIWGAEGVRPEQVDLVQPSMRDQGTQVSEVHFEEGVLVLMEWREAVEEPVVQLGQ